MIICPNPTGECMRIIGHIIHKKIFGESVKIVAGGSETKTTMQKEEKERDE